MTYGWAIVSDNGDKHSWRPHGLSCVEITIKKHYLKIRSLGGLIFATEHDAFSAIQFEYKKKKVQYFKYRIQKHWLFKPTRKQRLDHNLRELRQIMEV
jgi:hypothetical protein